MPRSDPLATNSGQQPRRREFVSQLLERVFYASERRELNRTLMAVEIPD
jgi:phage baseplate assembly protein W